VHGYISGAVEPWASGTGAAAVVAYIRSECQLGETFGFTFVTNFWRGRTYIITTHRAVARLGFRRKEDWIWQTRRDTDTQGYRNAGDQIHSERTLYPAGYSLDRDQLPGGTPSVCGDCLLAIA